MINGFKKLIITQKLATKCIGGNPIRSYYKKKRIYKKKRGKKSFCYKKVDALTTLMLYFKNFVTGWLQQLETSRCLKSDYTTQLVFPFLFPHITLHKLIIRDDLAGSSSSEKVCNDAYKMTGDSAPKFFV